MLFTKGQYKDIDQRHYFREVVFAALDWKNDTTPGREHLERAQADFRLVIKNIDCGVSPMKLSHDSRTDSRAYEQNNSLTELHWGNVRKFIAREDYLGRTLSLYRDKDRKDLFVLEID